MPSPQQPLSQDEVNRRLAAPTSAQPSAPSSSPSSSPSGAPSGAPSKSPSTRAGGQKSFRRQGGIVVAQCVPQADIVTTTPAQGYEFKDIEAEDGGQRVRFESDDDVQVSMQVTCSNGRPSVSTRVEGDDDDDDDSGEG